MSPRLREGEGPDRPDRGTAAETAGAMELVLKDVGFSYDRGLPTEKAVLRSLSLCVRSGQFVSVAGRTGSGKTTLGLIMAGLLKPQSGRASLRPDRPAAGRLAITRVELRPRIAWGGERKPSAEELERMHHAAHENCFIANSVKTEVTVKSL